MAKTRSYQTDLLESLKDPVEAAEYLNAALEEGEPEVFLLALRDVVDSHGGMGKLAASTSLNRENLYRMLSSKGNPEYFSLSAVLSALGLRLAVEPKTAELPVTSRTAPQIVLRPYATQVKEPTPQYALAAYSDLSTKNVMSLKTNDDKEVGTIELDSSAGTLILKVTGDIPLKKVNGAEIQTRDGKTVSAAVSLGGKNRLVLLRKEKIYPKDISQITLSMAG